MLLINSYFKHLQKNEILDVIHVVLYAINDSLCNYRLLRLQTI